MKETIEKSKQNTQNSRKVGIIPNVSFLTTLRNSGYNNYTAIADIVDNSLDEGVDSKNIRIEFEKKQNKENPFNYIKIHDDGSGMDYNTLVESLKLGSQTGKSRKENLGSYGTGMKAASLSFGRRFVVKTKTSTGYFYIAEFDLDEMLSSGNFEINIRVGSTDEYTKFIKDIKSTSGTSVIIEKIDRIDNKNPHQFTEKLKKDFGLFYRVFIEKKGVNIFINNESVKPFDPMFRFPEKKYSTLLSSLNETFEHCNRKFTFNAYYIHKVDLYSEYGKKIKRNASNAGLYIYRNNRLVGSGLDLGILDKQGDGYLNGIRIELFIEGDSDELFGSTFMKMIHEKDKNEINQEFKLSARKALKKYSTASRNIERVGKSTEKVDEDIEEFFKKSLEGINKNKLIDVKKKEKKESEKTDSPGVSGGNNPESNNPNKKPLERNGKPYYKKREDVFADWKFENLGENGALFKTSMEGGKHIVHMNTDHVFWSEFLRDSTDDTKAILTRLFVSMAISLDTIGYYDNAEKESLIQEYLLEVSSNLRKLIIG